MIERLTLRNFRAHEKLTLDFPRGVVTLTADNDKGKSTVIWALHWLAFNSLSGDSFVRHGADLARATLDVDGRRIVRRRGKKENSYTLDGEAFHALGRGVPDSISTLLNLDENNFQLQHDPHFWFFKSAGEVSREINRIVDLSLMDRTTSRLQSDLKAEKARGEAARERMEASRKMADALKWTEDAKDSLDALEALETDMASRTHRIARGEALVESLSGHAERLRRAQRASRSGEKALAVAERVRELQDRVERMEKILREYDRLADAKVRYATEIESLERQIQDVEFCPSCGRLME